jgi:hypothetical protein
MCTILIFEFIDASTAQPVKAACPPSKSVTPYSIKLTFCVYERLRKTKTFIITYKGRCCFQSIVNHPT